MLFSRAGESLTRRLRLALFANILQQDGAYFDKLEHQPGKLSHRLSSDAPNVRAAIDQRLSDVVQSFSAIIAGIVIAFSASSVKKRHIRCLSDTQTHALFIVWTSDGADWHLDELRARTHSNAHCSVGVK